MSLFLVSLLSLLSPARAEEERAASDARLIDSLRSFIPHVMREHRTPGLSIALARRGKIIWSEGFGYADLETKAPMTPETVQPAGSISKLYTATAVLQLAERGIFKLTDPVNEYLDFKVVNPLGGRDITFYDLLTHQSGLGTNGGGAELSVPPDLEDYLRAEYEKSFFKSYDGRSLPRWTAKVGEQYTYSNFGIATLGYLVEVTNPEELDFSDYVRKHILEPLGMTSTRFPAIQDEAHLADEADSQLSTGYMHLGSVHLRTPKIRIADYPAISLIGRPEDHVKLLLAYLGGGSYEGNRLLQKKTVRAVLSPQVKVGELQLGLGWFLRDVGETSFSFGHSGSYAYGWANDARAYPSQDFALSIATNHLHVGGRRYAEMDLIANFVTKWLSLERKDSLAVSRPASWAWKTSYVIGLIMVERTRGALGIRSPITPAMIDEMAKSAQVSSEESGEALWDPEGFRAGVLDMSGFEDMSAESIREFLRSPRLKVAPEELELLTHQILGSDGPRVWALGIE